MFRAVLGHFLLVCFLCHGVSNAGFVLHIDPDDLQYNLSGEHLVDLYLSHDGTGSSSLNGLQIDITNASTAAVRQGDTPTGLTGTAFLSSNVNAGNRYALGDIANFEVPTAMGALLTTLTFDVTANQDFTIGLDFVSATRDSLSIADSIEVPPSFTVTAAIPEPSSAAGLTVLLIAAALRRARNEH